MKNVIKLTQFKWDGDSLPILIGTESIIRAEEFLAKHHDGRYKMVTKIESRGAMVTTTYVTESVETIYEQNKELYANLWEAIDEAKDKQRERKQELVDRCDTITIDLVIDLLERFEGEGCVTDDLLYYMRHNLNLTK